MSADPADRTATLQPTIPSKAPARDEEPADEAELPIDSPERYEHVAEHARGGLGRVVRAVDKRLEQTKLALSVSEARGHVDVRCRSTLE